MRMQVPKGVLGESVLDLGICRKKRWTGLCGDGGSHASLNQRLARTAGNYWKLEETRKDFWFQSELVLKISSSC